MLDKFGQKLFFGYIGALSGNGDWSKLHTVLLPCLP